MKKLNVLISGPGPGFPFWMYSPIVWLQLRHYSDQDPALAEAVRWLPPIVSQEIDRAAHVYRLESVDVLGLSSFIWNESFNQKLAALYKSKNPGGLVVMGGAQVDLADHRLFSKNPAVDLFVRGEGEIAFSKILKKRLSSETDFRSIAGIHQKDFTNPQKFSERMSNYSSESYYEKYSSDLDRLFASVESEVARRTSQQVKPVLNMMVESDRGCPYRCQFCSWGGPQGKKLLKFELSRAKRDIAWSFKRNYGVQIINANLGFFQNDVKLVQFAGRIKKRYRSSSRLGNDWAKSDAHWQNVRDMAIRIYQTGLSGGFKLSLQSTADEVLSGVGRKNLSPDRIRSLVRALNSKHVPITSELIFGLPGDNLKNLKTSVADCMENGIFSFLLYPYILLPGSESFSQENREKNGVVTIYRNWYDFPKFAFEVDQSMLEYCVQTYSYSRKEYVEMSVFFAMVANVVTRGLGLPAFWFARSQGASYSAILDRLMSAIDLPERFPTWSAVFSKIREEYRKFVDGEVNSNVVLEYLGKAPDGADCPLSLEDRAGLWIYGQFEKINQELFEMLGELFPRDAWERFEDLKNFNSQAQDRIEDVGPKTARSRFDWLASFQAWREAGYDGNLPTPELRDSQTRVKTRYENVRWKTQTTENLKLWDFASEFLSSLYLYQPAIIHSLAASERITTEQPCGSR